jgi:S1-C subfamily serine protease
MTKTKLFSFVILLIPIMFFGQTSVEIAKKGIKSTVSIVALDKISQPLGYGSGFIIDNETVVTNVHVIEGCNSAYVLINGQEKKYSVNGYLAIDKTNDLVILKVTGLIGSSLTLGSEMYPEIGEKIYAIGNPKGLNGTFSEGIVSGIRTISTNQALQITAPISPGSSGGPVLNSEGLLVGIAFASYTEGQNLNFAIPVKYLKSLKSKINTITPISTIKVEKQVKTTTTITPNISEGVSVRNIKNQSGNGQYTFSIKNNLDKSISNITILFLLYDEEGVVVDYFEETFFTNETYGEFWIKPYLAKLEDFYEYSWGKSNSDKVKARILDFKIIDN